MRRDKIVDEINRLLNAGYHSEYPPLKKLLDELERIDVAEEKYARLGEV
jgi:hypothetical protein